MQLTFFDNMLMTWLPLQVLGLQVVGSRRTIRLSSNVTTSIRVSDDCGKCLGLQRLGLPEVIQISKDLRLAAQAPVSSHADGS